MNPTDLRNLTWTEVQKHIGDDMLKVHAAWRAYGPGTTRQVAERAGISLLTLRPRTTDLCQIGLVECTSSSGTEGIYEARTTEHAENTWLAKRGAIGRPRAEASPTSALREVNTAPTRDELAQAAAIMSRARSTKHARRARTADQQELSFS